MSKIYLVNENTVIEYTEKDGVYTPEVQANLNGILEHLQSKLSIQPIETPILPRNSIYFFEVVNRAICVTETLPAKRNITIKDRKWNRVAEEYIYKTSKHTIYLPCIQWYYSLVKEDDGTYRFTHLWMTASMSSVKSVDDKVNQPRLPNIFEIQNSNIGLVCMPANMIEPASVKQVCEAAYESYWASDFNYDTLGKRVVNRMLKHYETSDYESVFGHEQTITVRDMVQRCLNYQ